MSVLSDIVTPNLYSKSIACSRLKNKCAYYKCTKKPTIFFNPKRILCRLIAEMAQRVSESLSAYNRS